ncbi:MAG: BtaA family protein [Pyrinomonadaceae bacterium]|nr:BtaA family protein [Pyrinomonadaceae bacterium]
MGESGQTVRKAVRQESASAAQGILQRLFAIWFDAFVYNQIWEDPSVDLKALRLDNDSRILTISSGGCNALTYLLESPESVTAVDLNRNHIHLLNLKKAAAEFLPGHQEFFEFFGYGKGGSAVENYFKFLAPNLEPGTREFWESSSVLGWLTTGKRVNYFRKGGLYEHSRNGYFLRVFHRYSKLIGCDTSRMLTASGRDEQKAVYEEYVEPFFDSFVIRAVGKMPVTLFGLGIPPQQYRELRKDLDDDGSIIDIYRARTKKLAVDYPIEENYFAWQAFGRRYDTEMLKALPEYLKRENFELLKRNISKLETKPGSVTDEIAGREEGAFNRFVLLDAQDWMDDLALNELWGLIVEKADAGSRVIFRTAGKTSPLERSLAPELMSRFTCHQEDSLRLFEQDRASIYGGFHLYSLD